MSRASSPQPVSQLPGLEYGLQRGKWVTCSPMLPSLFLAMLGLKLRALYMLDTGFPIEFHPQPHDASLFSFSSFSLLFIVIRDFFFLSKDFISCWGREGSMATKWRSPKRFNGGDHRHLLHAKCQGASLKFGMTYLLFCSMKEVLLKLRTKQNLED